MILEKRRIEQQADEELLQAYKRRPSPAILGALFRRHYHKVYGLCLSYLKNAQDAEDSLMDIFESLPEKIGQYHIEKFEPWLYFVSRNYCLKVLKQKTRQQAGSLEEIKEEIFMEFPRDEDHNNEERRLEMLSDAIDQLPEGQRECIILFFLEHKSYQEISEQAGFSMNEVKSHIQNGKRNLRNLIGKLA